MRRRTFVVGAIAVVAVGCTKKPRCRRCGMALDAKARFYAEIRGPGDRVEGFDTPKCALTVWLSSGATTDRSLWVTGYYSGKLMPATDVLFAQESDVLGPMGHDLVPAERDRATIFQRDHAAKEMLELSKISKSLAEGT